MEGRREDVETSPSPFSSAVSLPREVDGLSEIGPLLGVCHDIRVDVPQPCPYKCWWPNLDSLHVVLDSGFESFSLTTCSCTMC